MLLEVCCIGSEVYWSFSTSVFTTPGGKETIILQCFSLQAEYSKPLLYQVLALLNTVISSDTPKFSICGTCFTCLAVSQARVQRFSRWSTRTCKQGMCREDSSNTASTICFFTALYDMYLWHCLVYAAVHICTVLAVVEGADAPRLGCE